MQAGREIRIMVDAGQVNDDQAFWIAKDVTKRIEGEMQYPGQIKVTVMRETRAVEYARKGNVSSSIMPDMEECVLPRRDICRPWLLL